MPSHEHDNDAVSPFRPNHVHEPWPYVCATRRSRPCPYVRTWPYFLSCTLAAVCMCTCYVRASTTTRALPYLATVHRCRQTDRTYVRVRDQNDNATYTSTRWVPTVRHFLACEDVAGGSQQSGGRIVFLPGRTPLRVKVELVGPSSQGERFFHEIRWHVRWVPTIRWRNNYFVRNKEVVPCGRHGPSCQPLHV